MGDVRRIERAADVIAADAAEGGARAVIVSAMGHETDRLVDLVESVMPDARAAAPDEYDVVVSSGEQVSAGLLAMALRKRGLKARSWTGEQAGVRTYGAHAGARVAEIDAGDLAVAIDAGEIAVITGFQGLAPDGRVATLGRGGSDVTAVSVAIALGAERCDVYTDVDGVFTTDPRIEPAARLIDKISYDEMLEFASLGASVMQTRSVELAKANAMPIRVASSLRAPDEPNPGTLICTEEADMEKRIVAGVAYARDEALVSVLGLPGAPTALAALFAALGDADINVDMIVQGPARAEGLVNVAFSVGRGDLDKSLALIRSNQGALGFSDIETRTDLSKLSVVGVGMRSHAGVAKTMFSALADKKIDIEAVSTSEIKISTLIAADDTEVGVRALHAAYGLDRD